MPNRKAIVLLSGGLDSATVLAIAKSEGYQCHCLSFDYGQRHRQELAAARAVAHALGVAELRTAVIDLNVFGGSALTDPSLDVPKDQVGSPSIPITYVPARNTIFLSFALAYAETRGAFDLFLGVNALDYSGYPDCRPEYIAAFEKLANLATRAGVESQTPAFHVHTPLIHLKKSEIIRKGLDLGVPYQLTHSCYDPTVAPNGQVLSCGHCDSCLLRLQGFKDAGARDPVPYV